MDATSCEKEKPTVAKFQKWCKEVLLAFVVELFPHELVWHVFEGTFWVGRCQGKERKHIISVFFCCAHLCFARHKGASFPPT